MTIICLVCFVMTMFLWLLGNLGAVPNAPVYSPWLAWFACLFLGLAVFLGAEVCKCSNVRNSLGASKPGSEFIEIPQMKEMLRHFDNVGKPVLTDSEGKIRFREFL